LPESSRKKWSRILHRGTSLVDRLIHTVKDVAGTTVFRQALGAQERGNMPAAFWLIGEAFRDEPDSILICTAFWDIAFLFGDQKVAVPAAMKMIHLHARTGAIELACQHWIELIDFDPSARVDPGALTRMLPTLFRHDQEEDEKEIARRSAALLQAVRAIVDDENHGLTPGVAVRVAEIARGIDPPSALKAARFALESPDLHEVKRNRLVDIVVALDPETDLVRPAPVFPEPAKESPPPARESGSRATPDHARNHPLATESPAYSPLQTDEVELYLLPPTRPRDESESELESVLEPEIEGSLEPILEAVLEHAPDNTINRPKYGP
jgi:hypothetical protein